MKSEYIYVQDDTSSCGASCIRSIVSFYGGYVPLETAIEDTHTDKTGTNAFEMVRALEKYGFIAYGIHANKEDIKNLNRPFIAHTIKEGYEHFIVVYDIKDDKILSMDPAEGKKYYSKEEFFQIFDGNTIMAKPKGKIPKYRSNKTFLKSFVSLIKENKKILLMTVSINLIVIFISIFLSFQLKMMSIGFDLFILTVILLSLKLLSSLLTYIKDMNISKIVKRIDDFMVTHFTNHLFSLPKRFLNNKRIGEIVKKIDDMTFIKDVAVRIIFLNSIDILTIASSLIIMFCISPSLCAIYLLFTSLYVLFSYFNDKKLNKHINENVRMEGIYKSKLIEYIGGLESIKNLNSERRFTDNLEAAFKAYTSNQVKLEKKMSILSISKSSIMEVGTIIINLIGFMLLDETFTFYDLFSIGSIYTLALASLENIFTSITYAKKSKVALRNTNEFLDIPKERNEIAYNGSFKSLNVFNLSFSYDHYRTLLKNFSYKIERGDKILINGPSGSGKSTLVKCLSGCFTDYSGAIYLNDLDIKNISIKSLRDYIIYVGQDEHLFEGSIKDNITLGNVDEQRFKKALKLAFVDDIIFNKPQKEDTLILEGASNISGGERSRIFLARAIYRKPSVLIIDETLSSIGEDMEDVIIKNLQSIEDLTLIYITHRNKERLFSKKIILRKGE